MALTPNTRNFVTFDAQGGVSVSQEEPAWMRGGQVYSQPQPVQQNTAIASQGRTAFSPTKKFFDNPTRVPDVAAQTNAIGQGSIQSAHSSNIGPNKDSDFVYENIRSFESSKGKGNNPLINPTDLANGLRNNPEHTLLEYSRAYGPEFKQYMQSRGIDIADRNLASASADVQKHAAIDMPAVQTQEVAEKPSLWRRFADGVQNFFSKKQSEAEFKVETNDRKGTPAMEKNPIGEHRKGGRGDDSSGSAPQAPVDVTPKPLPKRPGYKPLPIPPAEKEEIVEANGNVLKVPNKQLPATPAERPKVTKPQPAIPVKANVDDTVTTKSANSVVSPKPTMGNDLKKETSSPAK